MSPALHQFISLDLPAMVTGTLAVLVCGILGNFLLLRRLSLLGDAISHSVLPGLVAGFFIAGTRNPAPMFIGAAVAGLATIALVEIIRKLGRVESGAAMGVAFSILFALGVLLIEQSAARGVDLDPDCVLNGQLESVFWTPPAELSRWSPATLLLLPRQLWTLAAVALIAACFVVLFFKELRLAAFDPALAAASGRRYRILDAAFMTLIAAAVVASFEAVGSILVIAMLVCPGACARLLTDRLWVQIWLSAAFSVTIGIVGYTLASLVPLWLGLSWALSAAGMMAALGGVALAATMLLAPRYGLLARRAAHIRLSRQIAREDLLSALYRAEESGATGPGSYHPRALATALSRGEVERSSAGPRLTDAGRAAALDVVRRHRLWETYLVREAGMQADHVHPAAEQLEHLGEPQIKIQLDSQSTRIDPHGKAIPPVSDR